MKTTGEPRGNRRLSRWALPFAGRFFLLLSECSFAWVTLEFTLCNSPAGGDLL